MQDLNDYFLFLIVTQETQPAMPDDDSFFFIKSNDKLMALILTNMVVPNEA